MLKLLDVLLTILHLVVIVFNLLGWVVPKWRKAHFWCVVVTLFSWMVLGIWKGWGYCFLTDWAWQIKRELGEAGLPNSFITYIVNNKLSFQVSPDLVDTCTVISFAFCIVVAVYFRVKRRS